MSSKTLTVILLVIVQGLSVYAQDFDADSIYYTPIPRTVEQPKKANGFVAPTQPDETPVDERLATYFFNIQVGPLVGCSDCVADKEVSFSFSTVHGVTIGEKFRIGGGIGFDSYYDWQTMPIFASTSWDLLGTRNTHALFIQVNYGWSMPWRTEKSWEFGETSVEGGQMVHFMAGMRFKYHDMRFGFTIGGKFQSVSSYFETPSFYFDNNGNLIQGNPSRTTIEESMSRFAIGMTIGWK